MSFLGMGQEPTSQAEIIAAQEAAEKKEKERLATETAKSEADAQAKAQTVAKKALSKRAAFASGALESEEEDEALRKKFLKAV